MKKRTLYNLHHQVATMGYIGYLTPFLMCNVNPGDTWSGKTGLLCRMSPLKRPLLQDMYVDQYVFYVPNRLTWSGWEDFIAAGPNDDSAVAQPPSINTENLALFRPQNGVPTFYQPWYQYAYNLIWNEYFRDQATQAVKAPGDVSPSTGGAWPVSPKRHYWNELRPEEQTGTEAIALVKDPGGSSPWVTARDILRAIAEQKLQMKRATYGTRYVDILRSFGVSVNYQMLQRPEMVASAHGVINVTDVVSTAGPADLGKTSGYGVQGGRISIRRKSFPEHGVLLGVMVVRPPFGDSCMVDYMDKSRGYESYYDPALELLPPVRVTAADVIGPSIQNPSDQMGYMPWGEWFRKGHNRIHATLDDWVLEQYGFPPGVGGWQDSSLQAETLYTAPAFADSNNLFIDVTYGHYQVSAVHALRALRLIQKGNPASRSGST